MNSRWKKTLVLIAALVCLGVFARLAAAQGLDPQKIKKVPHFTTLNDTQFMAQTEPHDEHPTGDKFLAYSIRLPKGWRKQSEGVDGAATPEEQEGEHLSRHIMGRVAKYYGPANPTGLSRMEIQALELDYDLSARDWFLNYILTSGFTLEGMEEVSPGRLEAVYVLIDRDVSYVVRTLAQINGPRVILVSYYLPESHWNDDKALQEKVLQSFTFTNPEKIHIEPTHTYAFLDLLRFDYPASWRLLAPNIDSSDKMDARLISTRNNVTMNGEIGLHILSTDADTTLAQEVETLRGTLKDSGLTVGKLIEVPQDYKFHGQVVFNRVEVYETKAIKNNSIQDQEYWLAIIAEDRYYYIATMLTPGRNSNFLMWARNTSAFRSMIESIRL